MPDQRCSPVQIFGWIVLGIAILVLTSVGGLGVVVAPLMIPLLFLLGVTTRSRSFRIAATTVLALTFGEVIWVVAAGIAPGSVLVGVAPIVALGATAACAWRLQSHWSPFKAHCATT